MSQLERVVEEKTRRNYRTLNGNGGKTRMKYVSYNPTKEERKSITELPDTLEDILDFMSTYCQDGHSLTLKYMTGEECYSLTLKENSGDWQKDRALSCWHVDWLKCYRMMYHALHNRYSAWPNLSNYTEQTDLEW